MQNPIFGLLLCELCIGKKDAGSALIKKAPNTNDIDIQSRLNSLKENLISFNSNNNNNKNNNDNNNNNNNDNNNFLPPRPPPSPPPSAPKQDIFFQPFPPQQTTPKQNFLVSTPRIPSVPPAPALLPDDYFLINTKVGENVIKKTEKVIENIDNALNEVHELPEIELADSLINIFSTNADEILQGDNVLNEKTIEEIKDSYDFDQIKDNFKR